ncbi:glycoside hydrolase family 32 protein [Ceratobasidium sp. AG-Ba]|nr:glycoside hydrolase family 32 protein [Ceratobasidium sp. AG-Ba]
MAPQTYPRRALLFAAASATCAAATSWPEILPRAGGIDFSAAPPNLTFLANNSLFTHWRPRAHFIAPNSWMNDPMALWYKPDGQGGGKFKASYQAHPNHVQWGNISQASAVSDDLIHWKDVPTWKGTPQERLTLYPSQINDRVGVFDGTMIPSGGYKGFPTLIYTGVKYLPTGWTIPYTPGTETQNLAWTEDGGVTWKKLKTNPVIGGPPAGMNITAFRDPWLFQSPALAKITASNPGTPTPQTTFNGSSTPDTFPIGPRDSKHSIKDPWFMTVSGGVKGEGPHLLLYRQDSTDFTKWVYLGELFKHAANYSYSEWSGNWGFNFEVSTVLRLGTEGDQPGEGGRDFVTMGTEGGRPEGWANHWPLWVKGSYSNSGQLQPEYAGVADWGETYAFMSFPVPRSKGSKDYKNQPTRQILFGWAYEDDNNYGLLAKGWNGMFTLPREMFVKQWKVQDSRVDEPGAWGVVSRSGDVATVETLGTRPAQEVSKLWTGAKSKWSEKSWTYSGQGSNGTWTSFKKSPKSRYYVLTATLSFNSSASDASAGFTIYRSPDGSEETHIYYDFAAETIRVDRSKSSLVTGFNLGPEAGKFRLWKVPNGKSGTKLESLDLLVVVDNSVVEIYANDVFAMTTRIYPWRDDSLGLGYYSSGSGSVKFSSVKVYEGLTNAWPSRPANSSNQLVWDGEGYPWAGY